ncbi:hypothetical protein GCM10027435_23090 [Haloparvum alkalitolerans]|uniref:DUF7093 family protein n=1 Tax=Haloparvum alkalitolerans TaxID=1042953 RepID=UPI003CF331B6
MGLRCLLGHDFGEPELEREREEEGDEVVITVREVKTCDRCGEQQVVSENKEVTSIEQLADAADTAADAPADATDAEPAEPAVSSGDAEPAEPEAAVAEAEEPVQPDEPGAEPSVEPSPADAEVEDEDDAVFIDEGPDGADEPETVDGPAPDLSGIENEPADADAPAAGADAGGASRASDPETDSAPRNADEEDAEILDDSPGGQRQDPHVDAEPDAAGATGHGDWPDAGPGGDAESGDEVDAESDDGVILDEEPDTDPEREYGEWPEPDEEAEAAADEPTPWPEHRGDDEGYDATVDEGESEEAGVSFGGGLTPEVDDDAVDSEAVDDDAEFIENEPTEPTPEPAADREPTDGAGATDADATGDAAATGPADGATPSTGRDFTDTEGAELTTTMNEADTEYYCPECGMSRPADGNSIRAGDSCPECKVGYISERQL